MRRFIPAVLGFGLFAGCASPRSGDCASVNAGPAEIALGPVGVRGPGSPAGQPAADDGPISEALLTGTWERRVEGGRVRCTLDNHMIRLAVVEDRGGKEAFYVQGQWTIGGRNVLLCEMNDAALIADARSVPELDGADVIRSHVSFNLPALTGVAIEVESVEGKSFSFRVRPAGDGVVIDRFESAVLTDRAKRLFEGRYVREAAAKAGP
jgi:hypothetical protein